MSRLYISPLLNPQDYAEQRIGILCISFPHDVPEIIFLPFVYFDINIDLILAVCDSIYNCVGNYLRITITKRVVIFNYFFFVFFVLNLVELS